MAHIRDMFLDDLGCDARDKQGRAQVSAGEGQGSFPSSSTEQPGDTGVRGHTNVQIFIPKRAEDGARSVGRRWPNSSGSADPRAGRGGRLRPTAVIPSETEIR